MGKKGERVREVEVGSATRGLRRRRGTVQVGEEGVGMWTCQNGVAVPWQRYFCLGGGAWSAPWSADSRLENCPDVIGGSMPARTCG